MTGRWPFSSNCRHGAVIGLGAWVPDEAGEIQRAPRLVFLPMDEVTIEDTWDAHGLRATGSHHTSVTDATIELDRTLAFHEPTWPDGPLWRVPVFSALSPVLAAAPLGVAFGARDLLVEELLGGEAGEVRSALGDDPIGLAASPPPTPRCAARGRPARRRRRAVGRGRRRRPAQPALQARVVLASMHAVDVAVEVTSTMHSLAGGAAAYAPNPLVRKLRDVETARQHILFSKQSRPGLMRLAAGFDEMLPPYVYC